MRLLLLLFQKLDLTDQILTEFHSLRRRLVVVVVAFFSNLLVTLPFPPSPSFSLVFLPGSTSKCTWGAGKKNSLFSWLDSSTLCLFPLFLLPNWPQPPPLPNLRDCRQCHMNRSGGEGATFLLPPLSFPSCLIPYQAGVEWKEEEGEVNEAQGKEGD